MNGGGGGHVATHNLLIEIVLSFKYMYTHKSINPRFMNNYYSFAFHNLYHSGKGGIAQGFLILFLKISKNRKI